MSDRELRADWLADWMEDLGRRGFIVFVKYDGERVGTTSRMWTVIAQHPELKDQVFRADTADILDAVSTVDQLIRERPVLLPAGPLMVTRTQ